MGTFILSEDDSLPSWTAKVLRDGKEIYSGPADKIPDDVDGCDVVMAPDAYDSFRRFVARKQQQR